MISVSKRNSQIQHNKLGPVNLSFCFCRILFVCYTLMSRQLLLVTVLKTAHAMLLLVSSCAAKSRLCSKLFVHTHTHIHTQMFVFLFVLQCIHYSSKIGLQKRN